MELMVRMGIPINLFYICICDCAFIELMVRMRIYINLCAYVFIYFVFAAVICFILTKQGLMEHYQIGLCAKLYKL